MPTVNPTIETKLTTKTLGIADSKEKDLAGYIISTRDIKNATTKILIAVGVNPEDIRTIKVGSDKENNLRIICEVSYKAAFKKSEKKGDSWCSLSPEENYSGKGAFNETFYASLHNKVYHGKRKHLNMRVIRRPDPKDPHKTRKYVSFEFDPKILIAFVYDIVFTDPFYRISTPIKRWSSNFDNITGKEAKRRRAEQKELKNDGLHDCTIYVTYGAKAVWKKQDENGDFVGNAYKGFHPAQVDDYYFEN